MKLNQILISLEEYDSLRDFKENIKNGNTYYCSNSIIGFSSSYMTKEEATSSLIGELKKKEVELSELKEINRLMISNRKDIDDRIRSIREMSVIQFLKWRKK